MDAVGGKVRSLKLTWTASQVASGLINLTVHRQDPVMEGDIPSIDSSLPHWGMGSG